MPLPRVIGLPGAVLLGLGSVVGTGVFVSIGLAVGIAGPAVLLAILFAAALALCNGLSSAQLAAVHPTSGGTYEYGYRELTPALGFTAGWMFLCAKTASAATAALGFAGYVLEGIGGEGRIPRIAIAVGVVIGMTTLVAGGMKRSNRVNAVIVVATIAALIAFVAASAPVVLSHPERLAAPDIRLRDLLHATALVFVAFTGYARIATLGEEVREPRRTIPRAIGITVGVAMVLYLAVTVSALGVLGPVDLADAARDGAPLEVAAGVASGRALRIAVAIGAATAMLGVLLNLLLGLSRVVLAMSRRHDLPARFVHIGGDTPRPAAVFAGVTVGIVVLVGDIRTTWSFSAFAVLIYYAITNLAALRLDPFRRRLPPWIAVVGLIGCAGLAFWIDPEIWLVGTGAIAIGLSFHVYRRRRREIAQATFQPPSTSNTDPVVNDAASDSK
jgi:APA family basic amino acid/polyamine antiporter